MAKEDILREAVPTTSNDEFVDWAKEIRKNLSKVIRDNENIDALDDLASLGLEGFSEECSRRYFTTLLGGK